MSDRESWPRRDLLKTLAGAIGALLVGRDSAAIGDRTKFRLARLDVAAAGDERPGALERLAWELNLRTSVDSSYEVLSYRADERRLFESPFLILAGASEFAPLSEAAITNLRRHLTLGGLLLVDDTSGIRSSPFDASVRRLAARVFPRAPLTRLSDDHSIFRTYYLLRRLGGRVQVSPFLEGVTVDDRSPIIYCRNDLTGAWSADHRGRWSFDCVPGGEPQRQQAFQLGVNAVLYALTVNYKQDQVHAPWIRNRMRLRN